MENNKKYWKGLEELNNTPEFQKTSQREFAEDLPIDQLITTSESTLNTKAPRRDFLKALGFGVGAVTLAACNEAPVRKAIPYLVKPEEVTPGVANYYASTINGLGVLVKTREGRPIKLEGNPACPIGKGGLDAITHASLLNLYDEGKLNGPTIKGVSASWDAVDNFVKEELTKVMAAGKKVVLLSNTVNGPTTNALIAEFAAKVPNAEHVVFEPVSNSAIINANNNSFGKAVLPSYRFDLAKVIVSFDADFLGTWISPVEFAKQYATNRGAASLKTNKFMSRHIQFETGLSLTGSNADLRVAVKPSQLGVILLNLYNAVAKLTGGSTVEAGKTEISMDVINKVAAELVEAKGASLVVSGSNDVSIQVVVNAINSALGNVGTTVDIDNYSNQNAGNDAEFAELISEMNAGKVGAIFIHNANPSYAYGKSEEFNAGLKKVDLSVSFADRADETGLLSTVVAPDLHILESWNDSEAKRGVYGMVQPTIAPIYNNRAGQQMILNLLGSTMTFEEYLQNHWTSNILPKIGMSWNDAVRNGGGVATMATPNSYSMNRDLSAVAASINKFASQGTKVELTLTQSVGMRDGSSANNPWLQELPDPISKVTWDNYASVSPKFAKDNNIDENSMVSVSANGKTVKLPVLLQPGQAYNTISIAVGYGRTAAGKCGNGVGVNAFPMTTLTNGTIQFVGLGASISSTSEEYILAQTQTHHSIEGRAIVKETTFKEYKENPSAGNDEPRPEINDLWNEHEKLSYSWGMSIDLNSCIGCGSCVISCQTENNVPVVGRDEVRKRREMHWIRIDRYYTFSDNSGNTTTKEKEYADIDKFENIQVAYQPMMCQHCDHASCETVCPVLATMHSNEGLNQQVYNRCVGTKYCANNCPYKVRRFNWFQYSDNDQFDFNMNNNLGKLVLNPDVTVRSRGVMEKCSMCVQRIQAGKLEAKIAGKPLEDGKIQTACSQSCPTNAITFGDMGNKTTKVSGLLQDERTYYVLEELNVQPGVGYMTKVRNV